MNEPLNDLVVEGVVARRVSGWEAYAVTRCGRVFSESRGLWCELKPAPRINGYTLICMSGQQERRLVYLHRLVLMVWDSLPTKDRPWALHLDGDPTHNDLSNLYWGTPQDNADDRTRHGRTPRGEAHPLSKLRRAEVAALRLRALAGEPLSELAEVYGVSVTTVWRAIRGVTWAHVPGAVNDDREIGVQVRARAANDDIEEGAELHAVNDNRELSDAELAELGRGGADD